MITQNRILFTVGLLVLLVPFLGFPSSYESFFMAAAGVVIIVLAFMYARNKRLKEIDSAPKLHETHTEVFIENRPRFASDDEMPYTDLSAIKDHARNLKTF